MKSYLEKNAIEMDSTHNDGKSVIAEILIRILKNEIYNLDLYNYKLDNIVERYNNTYHSTIKMKPVGVKSSTCIDSNKKINNKNSKFKIVILLEYQDKKTTLQKVMFQIGIEAVIFLVKTLKSLCHRDMLLVILKANKLLESFKKENYKKQIKKSLELKM